MKILVLLCLALGATALPAAAQSSSDDGWHFQLSPYFWAAGVKGTVQVRRLPAVDVDASFSDVISNFDIGLLGRFDARKGRFGVATDLVYLNLGAPFAQDRPVLGLLEPQVDVRQFIGEGVAFYRVAQDSLDPERAYFDVLAGARYFHIHNEIDTVAGDTEGDSLGWLDAVGGFRGRAPLGSKAALLARGDIGGFGSNLSYNLEGSLMLSVSSRWSVGAGYRYLHEDYDTGEGAERRALDIGFGGPVFLATFAF